MRKFFNGIDNCDDLKAKYRELCKKFHPDNGGCAADFVAMKEEFRQLWDSLKNVRKTMNGERYTQKAEKQEYKSADEFMNLVDFLVHTLKVTVEINGTFLHVWGIVREDEERQTKLKEYVATLPKLKCKFSDDKGCWRIFPRDYHKKTNRVWTMDEIRDGFGSRVYKPSEDSDEKLRIHG